VVAPDGQVAVDLSGSRAAHALGRGAYVHPNPRCLASAPRGLTKSLRRPVDTSAARLGEQLQEAARRRVAGLIGSAIRSRYVLLGADKAGAAWQSGKVDLLVVARDAAAGALVGSVMNAVAQGGAVAWGTKEELGNVVGRSELGVLGIVSRSIATAIRSAMAMVSSVGAREAMQQSLVGGAVATEDR
jgi:ribosomal protein L7Ae-like RNA K-turn-binding protein